MKRAADVTLRRHINPPFVVMKKVLIGIVVVALAYALLPRSKAVTHGPGVTVPESPVQESALGAASFEFESYTIHPLANFKGRARVLSRKDYRSGRESDLSPVDLALGWGPMSDERVLEKVSIRQSGRWYFWQVREFPIPRRDIERNSANMHIIPASSEVRDALGDIREGQVIEFRGKLVKAEGDNNWRWTSSLTRDDTGDNACELVWVEELHVVPTP
jgi:hypothetical protein